MPKKIGRPQKEIDQKDFEKLCLLQCTEEEICGFFDVTDKTLSGWCKRVYGKSFSEVSRLKRAGGKISLRRAQFKMAEHNPTMAIWLGKQYLGQTDVVQEVSLAANDNFIKALNATAKNDWKEWESKEEKE